MYPYRSQEEQETIRVQSRLFAVTPMHCKHKKNYRLNNNRASMSSTDTYRHPPFLLAISKQKLRHYPNKSSMVFLARSNHCQKLPFRLNQELVLFCFMVVDSCSLILPESIGLLSSGHKISPPSQIVA